MKTFGAGTAGQERFKAIVAAARAENPFYARWITNPAEVPILDRETFHAHNDEILNGHLVNERTSGSTGVSARIAVSEELRRARLADVVRFVRQMGGSLPAAKIIYGKTGSFPPDAMSVLAPVDEQIDFVLTRQREAGACAVTTFPTNALRLCDRIEERGLDMGFVRRFGLYGECVEPIHRDAVRRVFTNAFFWSTYSSAEFGPIATSCPYEEGFHHLMSHRLGVELLEDDRDKPVPPGKLGRLVITDFLNRRSPLIRYEIGDYAVAGTCPCGRIKLPTLSAIYGKTRGALLHRNGERVPFIDLSTSLRDIPGVRQYQVIQDALEEVTVRLVADRRVDVEVGAALQAHFGYLPERVQTQYLDEIPRGPGGKFHHAICKVPGGGAHGGT